MKGIMEDRDKVPARPKKRDINGWLILDKPVGMTSTHAVAYIKRLFTAKKAGHAGTLDPLASGCLPIALGEATKTVPYVMDGRKAYRFTVAWGIETDTDDAEGRPIANSQARPAREQVAALLPRYTGRITQVPPRFSAIKVAGERAYDLARDGEAVDLQSREVEVHSLMLVSHEPAGTVLEAICGKGTYVRAIARDLGRALGCFGHVAQLRRTMVGPFSESDLLRMDMLEAPSDHAPADPTRLLKPVAAGLADLPALAVSRGDAGRLMRGQSVLLRGRDAPAQMEAVAVTCQGVLVAIGFVEQGELAPRRIFHGI
jgi:tRNA pseudouridine55 synthase